MTTYSCVMAACPVCDSVMYPADWDGSVVTILKCSECLRQARVPQLDSEKLPRPAPPVEKPQHRTKRDRVVSGIRIAIIKPPKPRKVRKMPTLPADGTYSKWAGARQYHPESIIRRASK